MAWRIHENVIRGEIDNRERGVVRGKLWLHGQVEPVALVLKGNACCDIAGCFLAFENTRETFAMRTDERLASVQQGTIGDLTASRKVRVFDIPVEEAYEKLKKKEFVPEHVSNSMYLEWFSEENGRVVVESAYYKLTISAPEWRATDEDEVERQRAAAEGFTGFIQKMNEVLDTKKHDPPEDKEWDEFDYEKFMRECDARTDKYSELLDKYMDHPDRDRIIAKEMGWSWLDSTVEGEEQRNLVPGMEEQETDDGMVKSGEQDAEDTLEGESDEDREFTGNPGEDGAALEPDAATEGVDWIRDENGQICHPLSMRALHGSLELWQKCDELGFKKSEDEDLADLIGQYQTTAAKLAGALNGLAYGRDLRDGAFIVAYLKRALNYLHASHAALERVSVKKLLPAQTLKSTRIELFALREEILRLMEEFRGKRD